MGTNPFGYVTWARQKGIAYQAYSVLGGAEGDYDKLSSLPVVRRIAAAHGVSAAAVALRWVQQLAMPMVVLSNSRSHLASNLQLFNTSGWSLTDSQMAELSALTQPAGRPSFWGDCTDRNLLGAELV